MPENVDEIMPWDEDLPPVVQPIPQTLKTATPVEIRQELQELVAHDLLGPARGPNEEITKREADSVRERYILGVLAPRKRLQGGEVDTFEELGDDGGADGDDGSPDTGAPQKGTMFPSSIGLTFRVSGEATSFLITASWGRYERVRSESVKDEKGEPSLVWKRVPHQAVQSVALASPGRFEGWSPDPERPEIRVQGLLRRKEGESDWTITLFLVNGQEEKKPGVDAYWLFQAQLAVSAPDGAAIFRHRALHREQGKLDAEVYRELRALEMLYRNRAEFAVGHGTAVHAQADLVNPLLASRIETRALPLYEVAAVEASPLPEVLLDMKELAKTPDVAFQEKLGGLIKSYTDWIDEQRKRVTKAGEGLSGFVDAADDALARCERACQRIKAGIDLLGSDPKAAEAFRFANRAMWNQRIRGLFAEARRRSEEKTLDAFDLPENRTWRPFQLAFILLNLPGLTLLDHPERSESPSAIADLLWFPTGGGKTEAYLGLTAYTLGLRRLQGEIEGRSGEHGVAVLMRYTLRLLTLQQFQRATALICACEAIRRTAKDNKWGTWPFRIGLWVGNKTTPNTTQQAEEAILARRDTKMAPNVGDPAQLTYCPWCGSEIKPGTHIKVDKGRGRTLIHCGDPTGQCPFSAAKSPDEGLPVLVVDEEIYRQLPSLLIATVDKFAQMPWNGVTQMLFGQVNGFCPRHGFRSPDLDDSDSHPAQYGLPATKTVPHGPLRPPDLIIQDELHLISGPLGSLVGLYETAVDYLASWNVKGQRVRPKVVASTATIRNSQLQVHKTFCRAVSVFPPQGLDVEDNFFARQSDLSKKPGRLYVGVCAPGRRLKSVLIRVYIAYMAAAQAMYAKYGALADPWLTTVGYFNSMRELGGMRRLVDDEIRSGLGQVERRGLPKRTLTAARVKELTSRISSTEIPLILDRLELPHGTDKLPIDVLLATNMISVGVDVRRLGLMIVANQPKTTAEYIQATSRVGRTHPGLVCTVLNWARPRDLSHFERFEHYHATFYQYVEALSVTPFAPRALDRGLSALLIAATRLAGSDINSNSAAAKITQKHPLVLAAKDEIIRRAWEVESPETRERVKADLDARVDIWVSRASKITGGAVLGYKTKSDGKTFGLLEQPGVEPWQEFTCLNSLRDVEPMVGLILDNYGMDDLPPVTTSEAIVAAPVEDEDEDGLL